jgi:predicted nucleotidyltransferase
VIQPEQPAPEAFLDPKSVAYVREVIERLRTALGDKLVGVYLHGSAVLGDFVPERSDVDIVAVSNGPLTDGDRNAVRARLSSESLPCSARELELHAVDRGSVSRQKLVSAFAGELEHASPAYQVLNACRAWRFLEENVLTSKLAGASWARERVEDTALIEVAFRHRLGESDAQPPARDASAFVESVLKRLDPG